MAILAELSFPYAGAAPDRISAPVANRFPVPPTAWGFLTDVDAELEQREQFGVATSTVGALNPESPYLEPTIGQIWPR